MHTRQRVTLDKGSMKTRLRPLGTFEVSSGAILISDPCYLPHEADFLFQVVGGTWKATVALYPDGRWHRVAALMAHHVGGDHSGERHVLPNGVDADSGTMSILCNSTHTDGDWYNGLREMGDVPWKLLSTGVVSHTGFGDGTYDVSVTYGQGPGPCRAQLVNSVRIDFITDKDL